MLTDEQILELLLRDSEESDFQTVPNKPKKKSFLDPAAAAAAVSHAPKPKAFDMFSQKSAELAAQERASNDAFLKQMALAEQKDGERNLGLMAPLMGAWAANQRDKIDIGSMPNIAGMSDAAREERARKAQLDQEKARRDALKTQLDLAKSEDKMAAGLFSDALKAEQKSLYAGKTMPPDAGKFVPQTPKEPPPSSKGDARTSTEMMLNSFGFARLSEDAFDSLNDSAQEGVRKQLGAWKNADYAIDETIAAAFVVGKDPRPTGPKSILQNRLMDLRSAARAANGMGVMSDKDMELLESAIPAPDKLDIRSVNAVIQLFQNIKKNSRLKLEGLMQAYNIVPATKVKNKKTGQTIWVPTQLLGGEK